MLSGADNRRFLRFRHLIYDGSIKYLYGQYNLRIFAI